MLVTQPDSTIRGGRLDKLITFTSINNDNRDPDNENARSLYTFTCPCLLPDTFIFRESFRALYTALSDRPRFIMSPLSFFFFFHQRDDEFFFSFFFRLILSHPILSRSIRLDREDLALFVAEVGCIDSTYATSELSTKAGPG